MSRLTLRNRLVLGSIYDDIYIILDRDRAASNREHARHVHIVLARANPPVYIQQTESRLRLSLIHDFSSAAKSDLCKQNASSTSTCHREPESYSQILGDELLLHLRKQNHNSSRTALRAFENVHGEIMVDHSAERTRALASSLLGQSPKDVHASFQITSWRSTLHPRRPSTSVCGETCDRVGIPSR
jgi:hypothetical protein